MKNTKTLTTLLFLSSIASLDGVHIKKTNARVDSIEDNISFWAFQEKEHAEFCMDFISNEKLKSEGKIIADKFQQLHTNPKGKKNEFLTLSTRIKKFQNNVRGVLNENDKDYKIKVALIDHMNLEADYAEKKVRGKRLTRNEELKFWMEEHKGEAEAISYFMKNDNELKNEADELVKDLKEEIAKPTLTLAADANHELDEIGEDLEDDPSKTRMPKKLAEHEKRERARAEQTFRELTINS